MSLQTWKEEFYPIAAKAMEKLKASDDLSLLNHSLKKWIGLRKENLEKHGIIYSKSMNALYNSEDFIGTIGASSISINGSSCSLCQRYGNSCHSCPLKESRGTSCDADIEETLSPWGEWIFNENPEPMILALQEAIKFVENQPKGE